MSAAEMGGTPSIEPGVPPLLELSGVTKHFGALIANDAIDLVLHRGEILALLGENGAGKTTLMSILFGHYVADEGEVRIDGRRLPPGSPKAALAAGIGMVHQHFTLAGNHSVLDNVMLGTEPLTALRQRRREARRRLEALIAETGLAVPIDAPVSSLSVGEQQRVELLKALYRHARMLILDEPTAVLTPQQAEGLFLTLRRLATGGLGIIFISHKLDEVTALCRRVAVLRHGRKVMETTTEASGKGALAHAMVDREVVAPTIEPRAAGDPILELRGVTVRARPGVEPLDAVDLSVRGGRVLGIAGVSGNGQRSLTGLLAGLIAPDSGALALAGGPWPGADPKAVVAAGIGRVPEDRHKDGVVGDMAVWENLALERYDEPACRKLGLLRIDAFRRKARALIERFDIRCPGPDARTRLLSGGNMQKLVLARALEREPRLVLACQPTRGLDVGAVAEVHKHLIAARARGAGVLLISEDLDELLALADEIAVIYRGRLSPPIPRAQADLRQLGLLMAGEMAHAA